MNADKHGSGRGRTGIALNHFMATKNTKDHAAEVDLTAPMGARAGWHCGTDFGVFCGHNSGGLIPKPQGLDIAPDDGFYAAPEMAEYTSLIA
ncbi:MAG: hypothetical protein IT582_09975 [Opitutaceae bacterium]|nr:hypothetical protein [Opitutaceae bacterium]